MRKITLLLMLWLLSAGVLRAQSISDIVVSKDGRKIAFLKDGDSLFVKRLDTNDNADLIDSGLRDNGNQRFLNWANDSKSLIYEKNENVWVYSLTDKKVKQVQHQYLDSLSLFQSHLIRQISVNDRGELFFSAGLKKQADPTFQLFRLNLLNGEAKRLTNSTLTVGNVAVSADNKHVAFASYEYTDDVPHTKVSVMNASSGKVLAETALYSDCFFSELKWSGDGRRILALDNENKSRLLTFDAGKGLTVERTLHLGVNEKAVGFSMIIACCILQELMGMAL